MLFPSLSFRNSFPFSGSTVAYSLRSLSSGTDNVIRVRRSSDNAEQDFNANEITDGTLATWIGANNGFVTTWYDQSGNSNHVTQATQANQPKIYDSATGLITISGKPAVQFISASPSYLEYPNTTIIAQPLTVFVVAQDTGVTDLANVLFDSNLGTDRMLIGRTATSFQLMADNTGTIFITQPTNNDRNLFYALANATSSVFALNGGTGSTGDIGTNSLAGLTLGGIRPIFIVSRQQFCFNGYLQEFVLYESDQSANRSSFEGNINNYYGIY